FAGSSRRLLPLALDLVDYHYHYAAALMAVPPAPRKPPRDILNRRLWRAESARLATFSYEILDILEAGEPDLPRLARALQPVGSFAVIYPMEGEVRTESLAEPYFRLLQQLDGGGLVSSLLPRLRIPQQDALAFLQFALQEGIVTC
ncbi:MAG TPA: B12-binding domain-containing radical SAM protein, partial [Verrucomicrobiae bacterium]|nr:B12-binding domain-containing radical SAM protein [Verrucomicrobiae bacterium]